MNPAFAILYCIYRLASELRYRLPRRITRAGLGLAGGFFVVSTIGLDTDNTVAYQAFALIFCLLLPSIPFLFFFKARFSAERLLPRFGTAGTPLRYRVRITNHSSRIQRGLTLFENLQEPRLTYREWVSVQLADQRWTRSFHMVRSRRSDPFRRPAIREEIVGPISPHQSAEVNIELTPMRRGLVHFSGLTLARPDPLGLVRAFAKVALRQTLLVLPKRYPLPPVALPGITKYQQGGVSFASDVGQSDEFVGLRDYRRGDPLRHIHWRSWAKAGKPIVKEFEDEFFVRHALVLDTFIRDPRSALFEEAVSVAASFACAVLSQESLLDLLFVGPQAYSVTAGRGLARADQILQILASVSACEEKGFPQLERLVVEHGSRLSGCILVLVAWDKARQELVRKLRSLKVAVLVLVLKEPGPGGALDPGPLRDEPERFHVLEFGHIEEGLATLK